MRSASLKQDFPGEAASPARRSIK